MASSRTTSHAIVTNGVSDKVASIRLQDLDLGRIDHGAWGTSFLAPPPTLTAGGSNTVTLDEDGFYVRRVDGVLEDPVDETLSISVPAPATIDGATFTFGTNGTPDGSTCTIVTPQQAECSVEDPVSLDLEVTPATPGTLPITVTNSSSSPEAVPDVRPNTATWELSVVAPSGELSGRLEVAGTADPLADAYVLAYLGGDGWFPSQTAAITTTDATGAFAFSGLLDGEYRLLVGPPASSGLKLQWLDGDVPRARATVFEVEAGDPLDVGTRDVGTQHAIAGSVTSGDAPLRRRSSPSLRLR